MIADDAFKGARALITGGMGFLGSALAIALVERGAQVTIMDNMLPGHGANLFNVEPIRERVAVTFSDIRDANIMNYLVQGQDFLFHLAGQVDHIVSLTDPYPDDFNYGIMYGFALRYLPPHSDFIVSYDPQVTPRDRGGEQGCTVIHIRWK